MNLPRSPAAAPSVSPADAAAELLRRRAARRGLLDFTTYTKPDYAAGWHHRLLCNHLDRFATGEITRLMVFMPPQHGKSELCSRRLPAKLLGDSPDLRVIACSNTSDLASDMNRDVQRIIEGDEYRRLYPGTQLSGRNVRTVAGPMPLRNSSVFEIVGHRGYYRAAGVGTAIVGRGFDVGIIDDPHAGREAADSPTQRSAVRKWYTGDFYTRRGKNARILLIVTRWHPDDLPGWLLKQARDDPKADQWVVLTLPAICEEPKHPDDPRQLGEALWPERYPLDSLEKTRAAEPYDFWSQYQQRPRNPGSTEWPESYFDGPGFWFDEWPALDTLTLRVMALDPSKGKESRVGDYQALIYWGRDKHGTEYIEADLGKRPMTASLAPDGSEMSEGMVETAVDGTVRFKPEGFALEVNGFQELLRIPFDLVAKRRKLMSPVPIYGLDNTINKLVRIRRLGPPLAQKRLRFRNTPGTRLLVEQLKQFPVGDHDDGPDSLEMARRLAVELFNERQ